MVALLVGAWPGCTAVLSPQTEEDAITTQLVDALSRNPRTRRLGMIEYQFPPFGHRPDGVAYSKGEIDIAVLLDGSRMRYLAYECKRLNVVRDGRRRSQAAQYVMGGVLRFIVEQYAEGLPVGSMLGYVMDGDLMFARRKVVEALERKNQEVGLVKVSSGNAEPRSAERFVSDHIRSSGAPIEIRHTLLSFGRST